MGTVRAGPVRLAVNGEYGAVPRRGAGVGDGDCRAGAPGEELGVLLSRGVRQGRSWAPPHALGSAAERRVSVLSELESVRAREGDSATFECTVSEVDTARSWALGGRPLRPGGRVRIRQEGLAGFASSRVRGRPAPPPAL